MSSRKDTGRPESVPADGPDVEGHNMWISPTMSRDLAREHSKELERAARERNRAKEAKGR